MIDYYVIIDKYGFFIGIDSSNSGYPFTTNEPSQIKYFKTQEEAQGCYDIFNYKNQKADDWFISKLNFILTGVVFKNRKEI